jgi:hypothetical protein
VEEGEGKEERETRWAPADGECGRLSCPSPGERRNRMNREALAATLPRGVPPVKGGRRWGPLDWCLHNHANL